MMSWHARFAWLTAFCLVLTTGLFWAGHLLVASGMLIISVTAALITGNEYMQWRNEDPQCEYQWASRHHDTNGEDCQCILPVGHAGEHVCVCAEAHEV